jgi:hypothetical protein
LFDANTALDIVGFLESQNLGDQRGQIGSLEVEMVGVSEGTELLEERLETMGFMLQVMHDLDLYVVCCLLVLGEVSL